MITAKNLVEEKVVRVNPEDSVSKVASLLKKNRASEALVFEGNMLKGIVSFRELFKNHQDMNNVKVGKVMVSSSSVDASESIAEMAKKMLSSNLRVLPVFEQGNFLGVVSANKLVRLLKDTPEFSSLKVSDIMSKNTITASKDDTVDKVVSLMKSRQVKKLPIMNDKQAVVGVVTWENLLNDYLSKQKHSSRSMMFQGNPEAVNQSVSPYIESEFPSAVGGNSVGKTLAEWPSASNSFMMVMDKGKLSGILTTKDVLKAFAKLDIAPRNIHFIDLPDSVDEIDLSELNSLVNNAYEKLEKVLGDDAHLTVHFKAHHVLGLRRKYDIHCRARMDNKTVSFNAQGWKLIQATHDALKGLEKVVLKDVKGKKR